MGGYVTIWRLRNLLPGGIRARLFHRGLDILPSRCRSSLWGVRIVGANLAGQDLSLLRGHSRRDTECGLIDSNFRGTNLRYAELASINLHSCNLQSADLQGSKLWKCSFRGSDLSNADLQGAYLRETSFEGARVDGADFTGARVHSGRGPYQSLSTEQLLNVKGWRTFTDTQAPPPRTPRGGHPRPAGTAGPRRGPCRGLGRDPPKGDHHRDSPARRLSRGLVLIGPVGAGVSNTPERALGAHGPSYPSPN